jgi:hypothetical protein
MLALLLLGWFLPSPAFWTVVVLAAYLTPMILASLVQLIRKPLDCTMRVHLRSAAVAALRHLGQIGLWLIFLPYEALYNLDAIIRTLFRVLVTRRRLLEWETASDVQHREGNSMGGFFNSMLMAPLLALGALSLLMVFRPGQSLVASPFLAIWMSSPAIAWLISQPLTRKEAILSRDQRQMLRVVARQTWRFFETFMAAEDHYLPPDNYQEYPTAVTAHRTSPTNIGLGLLSTLAACDFGYISSGELINRTTNTLRTMATMSRHRGHFYNWYDTLTLQPMPPLYVSTVDSGNLAGMLMTFGQGLLELASHPIVGERAFEGFGDTMLVLSGQIQRHQRESENGLSQETVKSIAGDLAWMAEASEAAPGSLSASVEVLEQVMSRATKIVQLRGGAR